MKKGDEVCSVCKVKCKNGLVCAPLQWVDGDKKRVEPLIRDLSSATGDFEYLDYNTALAELITDRELKNEVGLLRIKQILREQDYRTRGIGAMLLFQIPRPEIAKILKLSVSQVNRIYPSTK